MLKLVDTWHISVYKYFLESKKIIEPYGFIILIILAVGLLMGYIFLNAGYLRVKVTYIFIKWLPMFMENV